MDELDRQLHRLVSEVQKYPSKSPERSKKSGELWETMIPPRRGRSRSTDVEARGRLAKLKAKLKKQCHDQYRGKVGDFEENWADVLGDVQQEILKKIDTYGKGIDFELFNAWNTFSETIPSQRNSQCFCAEIEKFRTRFIRRRTKKNGIVIKDFNSEKIERLTQICYNFSQVIQRDKEDLNPAWDTFCQEVQKLYRPLKFWNFFAFYLKSRFWDKIRKNIRRRETSGDALIREAQENPTTQTRFDKIEAKARNRRPEIKLIDNDPDQIFAGKHIEKFPQVNFRAIALLKSEEATLKEIEAHFGNQVNAQTTIAPFYTRTCRYFKPILEEYLEAQIALPETVIDQIINDPERRYKRRTMKDHPQINFRQIIIERKKVHSWRIVAQKLQVNVTQLIYFYLDSIRFFKLITHQNRQHRRPKNTID